MFEIMKDDISYEELLKIIEKNNLISYDVKKAIKELELEEEIILSSDEVEEEEIEEPVKEEKDDSFEDEVAYYLVDYQRLDVGFTKEELKAALPFHRHQDYKLILHRLIAESLREIKALKELLQEETDEDQLQELRTLIQNEIRKMEAVQEELKPHQEETIEKVQEERNNIILAPTKSGSIRVIDEMKHIPFEYYASFKELVESVINGTFKGVKRFNNNTVLNGICEVKGFQVRILFQRLNRNTYALISAFIKKSDNDKGYQEYIKTRVMDYKAIADSLKGKIEDEEFLAVNEFNIAELYNIFNSQEKDKSLKKEMK